MLAVLLKDFELLEYVNSMETGTMKIKKYLEIKIKENYTCCICFKNTCFIADVSEVILLRNFQIVAVAVSF